MCFFLLLFCFVFRSIVGHFGSVDQVKNFCTIEINIVRDNFSFTCFDLS